MDLGNVNLVHILVNAAVYNTKDLYYNGLDVRVDLGEVNVVLVLVNTRVYNNKDTFYKIRDKLYNVMDLRGQAAGNGSLRKFAIGTATAPNFQTIYGLAQCTPDLTEQVCSDCLGSSLADIPECCQGKEGARISKPSCDVRYEIYRYFDPTTVRPLPSPPPSTSTGGSKSNRSRTVIIIVVPIVVSVARRRGNAFLVRYARRKP
ncbi:unnamed protein product [Prunus armeniaca]